MAGPLRFRLTIFFATAARFSSRSILNSTNIYARFRSAAKRRFCLTFAGSFFGDLTSAAGSMANAPLGRSKGMRLARTHTSFRTTCRSMLGPQAGVRLDPAQATRTTTFPIRAQSCTAQRRPDRATLQSISLFALGRKGPHRRHQNQESLPRDLPRAERFETAADTFFCPANVRGHGEGASGPGASLISDRIHPRIPALFGSTGPNPIASASQHAVAADGSASGAFGSPFLPQLNGATVARHSPR